MLRPLLRAAIPVCLGATMTVAGAQEFDITEPFELLEPQLTLSVVREVDGFVSQGLCSSSWFWECSIAPGTIGLLGVDAAGNVYYVSDPFDEPSIASGFGIERLTPGGAIVDVLRLKLKICTTALCSCTRDFNIEPTLDLVGGGIIFGVSVTNSCNSDRRSIGTVAVHGLPKMFDTLLTFIPGGQLSALVPAHPDGFRSAGSLQIWTGDLRTLPDWSRAEPLVCAAAVNPTPGQVVTVVDPLPDPAPGLGRYYVTASQHEADRRLGRQFVDGHFTARDPSSLPVCGL